MARMFWLDQNKRIKTWNPLIGCVFHCYHGACWARIYASRWKCDKCKKFIPHVHLERFDVSKFKRGEVVFAGSMTDIFCGEYHRRVLDQFFSVCRSRSDIRWFFETKNPAAWIVHGWLDFVPNNAIISSTIETDVNRISRRISLAPVVSERIRAMREIPWRDKHISIEPVVWFSSDFADKLLSIPNLRVVSIGYDNWRAHLPEPTDREVDLLIKTLRESGIYVEDKRCRRSRSKLISAYQRLADQSPHLTKN